MPELKTEYATVNVNHCSAETVEAIHLELLSRPLGTAMVFGGDLIMLLPLPRHSTSLSAISCTKRAYATEPRLPHLHAFEHLVRETLTDEDCIWLALGLQQKTFVTIPSWERWFIDYFQEMGERKHLSALITALESGHLDNYTSFRNVFFGLHLQTSNQALVGA